MSNRHHPAPPPPGHNLPDGHSYQGQPYPAQQAPEPRRKSWFARHKILTGILGAVVGPRVLTWLRVRDKVVRGLAVGVSSHGIGTAQMIQESRTEGAFSGLAMALTALATSIWLPVLVPLLT